MKKLSVLLVLALVLFIPFMTNVNAEKSKIINVYLFRGEGCPHCAEAEEFFDSLKEDEEYKDLFQVVDYEVWYDKDNASFMEKVAKKLKTQASGVPFIIIGDKYYSGYASSMSEEIKTTIKKAYESDEYKDVVLSLKNSEEEKKSKESNNIIPIVIVSVVALAVVVAMIFFTKEK